MKASIPGPCKPIELSIPLGVSAIRGVARPVRTFDITDLVTIPPMSRRGKNCASSRPELAQPLAVNVGAGNQVFPIVVEKSKVVIIAYQLNSTALLTHPSQDHQYTNEAWTPFHLHFELGGRRSCTPRSRTPLPPQPRIDARQRVNQ